MLLGISHLPSPSATRIPPSLFDLYLQYKQDTRAIIAWLISHGSGKFKNWHEISVRDLLGLAEIVQRKAVVMPDTIDFQFREAIAARAQLSKFFRTESQPEDTDDEYTVNHEFFTDSLNKIYSELCKCCAKPVEDCKRADEGNREQLLRNRFALFKPSATHSDCECETKPASDTGGTWTREGHTTASSVNATPQIIDDSLGDAFEVRKELQEMDDLLFATREVWDQVGRGETPLVVAAFITNAAFARFEGVEQRLNLLLGTSNPEVLSMKLLRLEGSPTVCSGSEYRSNSSAGPVIQSLQQIWRLLRKLNDSERMTSIECDLCRPKTSDITLHLEADSAEADEKCMRMILHDIKRRVRSRCLPSDIVREGSPLYAEVGLFLTSEKNDVNGLRCTFGLRMLLDASKSFVLARKGTHKPPNCRLQALKLAQEALPCLGVVLGDASMPCRCPQTLAYHIENLKLDLKAFFHEKCFDAYFQSPWVSGSHVLEMHETLFYYGLRLFSYRHYIGSVVHVYHILRRLTGFGSVPLLEQLRDTFNDVLFPGGRPSRSFKACCLRYMGGRLRFRADASDHKSGSHHMAIPAHTAKASAGFGLRKEANDSRFAYCKISLFYHVKEKGYHINESLWSRIHALAGQNLSGLGNRGHRCTHDHTRQEPTPSSCPHQLSHLQSAVLTDFAEPFPIARVNFFKVYVSCVQIISIISDKTHGGDDRGRNCLCFLDVMLEAADRYKDNEHKLQPFGCRELVSTCKEAMSAVLGERSLDDFLWKTF